MSERFEATTEADMLALGNELAQRLKHGAVVYLSGDLGVGKTTLVRGILRALGYSGRVKSPSYGLIESYEFDGLNVHHLDLYRLSHGEEITYLGLEDLFDGPTLLMIEWPEKGRGFLPPADWSIEIADHPDASRTVQIAARQVP